MPAVTAVTVHCTDQLTIGVWCCLHGYHDNGNATVTLGWRQQQQQQHSIHTAAATALYCTSVRSVYYLPAVIVYRCLLGVKAMYCVDVGLTG